jgi:hypothetical protein
MIKPSVPRVYVMQINDVLFKIGKAMSLDQRIPQIKRIFPNAKLLYSFITDDNHVLEERFQQAFKYRKANKFPEWALSKELYKLNPGDKSRIRLLPFNIPIKSFQLPKPPSENNMNTAIKLDPILYDQICQYAHRHNLHISQLFNAALQTYNLEVEQKYFPPWESNILPDLSNAKSCRVVVDQDIYDDFRRHKIGQKDRYFKSINKTLQSHMTLLNFYTDLDVIDPKTFLFR